MSNANTGTFQVDTHALGTHATDVDGIAGEIEDAMLRMQRKLESLHTTWKGAAAAQYNQLHDDWHRQQDNVKDSLRDISRVARAASGTYSRTEDDVRASFVH